MYDIYKLTQFVKSKMSDKRFRHSLGVAKLAKSLAHTYNLDEEKAYVAGLLHDITKEMDEEYQNSLFIKHNDLDKIDIPRQIKHSYSSKYYLIDEMNIDDEEILDAVYNHTVLKSNMILSKIIYIADKREENRNLNDGIVELAYKDLNAALVKLSEEVDKYLASKGTTKWN